MPALTFDLIFILVLFFFIVDVGRRRQVLGFEASDCRSSPVQAKVGAGIDHDAKNYSDVMMDSASSCRMHK
jgi:hypothetical protein